MSIRPFLFPIAALSLAGCAADSGSYPSLAPRAIETTSGREPAIAPAPAAAQDPALETRVSQAAAKLDSAAEAFDAQLVRTRSAIAAAVHASAGSEAWINAQQALSALDAARTPATSALADLDAMRLEVAQRGDPIDTTSLEAAHARADALNETQRAALAELSGALSPP